MTRKATGKVLSLAELAQNDPRSVLPSKPGERAKVEYLADKLSHAALNEQNAGGPRVKHNGAQHTNTNPYFAREPYGHESGSYTRSSYNRTEPWEHGFRGGYAAGYPDAHLPSQHAIPPPPPPQHRRGANNNEWPEHPALPHAYPPTSRREKPDVRHELPPNAYKGYPHSAYNTTPVEFHNSAGYHDMPPPPPPPPPSVHAYNPYRHASASPLIDERSADNEDSFVDLPPPPPPQPGAPAYYARRREAMPMYHQPAYVGIPPPPPPPMYERPSHAMQAHPPLVESVSDATNTVAAPTVRLLQCQAQPDIVTSHQLLEASSVSSVSSSKAGSMQVLSTKPSVGAVAAIKTQPSPPSDTTPSSNTSSSPTVEKESSVQPEPAISEVPLVTMEPPPVQNTVRNEFAERLAQQALARLASKASGGVQSGLLLGTSTPNEARSVSPTSVLTNAGKATDAGTASDSTPERSRPARSTVESSPPPAALSVSSPTRSVTDNDTADIDNTDNNRPRLKLQPRTLPVAPAPTSTTSATAAAKPAGRAAVEEARRKLQLQPRNSKDVGLPDNNAKPASKDSGIPPPASKPAASSKSSIFGAARPREEVLKERGLDADPTGLESLSVRSSVFPHHGYASSASVRASRPASITSGYSADEHRMGDKDQWQTVGGKKAQRGRDEVAVGPSVYLHEGDPLISSYSKPLYNNTSYGSNNYHHGSPYKPGGFGHRTQDHQDDDGFIIKRGLPVRSGDF